MDEWKDQSTTRMKQWLSTCQPFIAYCLKNRSHQECHKTRDIRTYLKGKTSTQVPKTYTNHKAHKKRKAKNTKTQANTLDKYIQYTQRQTTLTSRNHRNNKKKNKQGVTDYYTNQGRPPDEALKVQTSIREYISTTRKRE